MNNKRRQPIQAVLSILMVMLCAPAIGAMSDQTLLQLSHTAWTEANGGPGDVVNLQQTTDGYLWVTTSSGLFRFDGARFERLDSLFPDTVLSPYVIHTWAAVSGGLWIAYKFGGVGFLRGNVLTNYKAGNGLPSGTARSFQEDRDHTIWVATSRGLATFDGRRWRTVGAEAGLPGVFTASVHIDQRGAIWVSGADTLWRRRPGAAKFEDTGLRGKLPEAEETPDGSMLLIDHLTGARKLEHLDESHPQPGNLAVEFPTGLMLFDQTGSLWTSSGDHVGITRIRKPLLNFVNTSDHDTYEHFDTTDGLSGDRVTCATVDREGNVWVGTTAGLDRFREVPFARVPVPKRARYLSVLSTADGRLWTASLEDHWLAVDGKSVDLPGLPTPLLINTLFADPDGSLWIGTEDGLWHLQSSKWSHIAKPAELGTDLKPIHVIAKDRLGDLWVSFLRGGVYRFSNGAWALNGNQSSLLKETAITITSDSKSNLWFGYTDNRATFLDGDNVRHYSAKDGLQIGNIVAISTTHGHIWFGGEKGLESFDGTGFVPVRSAPNAELGAVSDIIELDNGELWLNTSNGVVRIAAKEIAQYFADPLHAIASESFTYEDGVSGRTDPLTNPTIAQAPDGRLWFATSSGISWVDPKNVFRNPVVPPVFVQEVRVNDARIAPQNLMSLPAGTRTLQISYTALSLSIPERVRFRYRLEGQDSHWTDAGNRRTAFFTNLGPGKYQFSVTASNNDGAWNAAGDSVEIAIAPRFIETKWFIALCSAAAMICLWAAYLLRLRQVTKQMSGRLEARLTEREHIARELHDTLLQSMQGLMFRFQAVADRLPALNPVRKWMEDELTVADSVMVESRGTITGLRGLNSRVTELPEALIEYGRALEIERAIHFTATVHGARRPIHPVVFEETLKIGREAIANAFRHSKATLIEVAIIFERAELCVRVSDNGVGFDGAAPGNYSGHFGLLGMRERSSTIRARLEISSTPTGGTQVILRVPSAMAFRERPRFPN
jgi:signal transduction histidine kinase